MPRRSGARSATSSTRTPPRRVYAKGLAPLELRLPPLGEGAHALLQVLALRHQGLRQRLLLEAGLEAALVGALEEALREAERERRPAREALAPAARGPGGGGEAERLADDVSADEALRLGLCNKVEAEPE